MPTFQITSPDGQKYRVTGETAEGAFMALQKHTAQSSSAPKVAESYSGSILPFSRDENGVRFDSDAGIVGTLKRAFTLPGDVAAGKVDPNSDEALARSFDLAGSVVPVSPASGVARSTTQLLRGRQGRKNAGLVKEVLAADNMTASEVMKQLRAAGPDHMLADVGPSAQVWAGGLASRTGPQKKTVNDALFARSKGASARVNQAAEEAMGKIDDTVFVPEQIKARQRELAAPLYERLSEIDIPSNNKVLDEILSRPGAVKGLDEGATIAANKGEPFSQRQLNVRDIDYAKQAIDGEYTVASANGRTGRASGLYDLRKDLLEEMDRLHPEYPKARDVYAGEAVLDDAFTKGGQLFDAREMPLETAKRLKDMTAGEKKMFQAGARRSLGMKMGTARNDVNKIRAEFDESFNREKLGVVFGKENADALLSRVDDETAFMNTKNNVTANSKTAERQAVNQRIDGPASRSMEGSTLTGLARQAAWNVYSRAKNKPLGEKELEYLAKVLIETGQARLALQDAMKTIAAMEANGKVAPVALRGLVRLLLVSATNPLGGFLTGQQVGED